MRRCVPSVPGGITSRTTAFALVGPLLTGALVALALWCSMCDELRALYLPFIREATLSRFDDWNVGGGPCVVLDVARDGEGSRVWNRDRGTLDAKQLRILLFQYAECLRDMSDPEQWSGVTALIRCDRDVPFREVQKIFDACLDPDVRIYRVEFAIRSTDWESGFGGR